MGETLGTIRTGESGHPRKIVKMWVHSGPLIVSINLLGEIEEKHTYVKLPRENGVILLKELADKLGYSIEENHNGS